MAILNIFRLAPAAAVAAFGGVPEASCGSRRQVRLSEALQKRSVAPAVVKFGGVTEALCSSKTHVQVSEELQERFVGMAIRVASV